MEDDKTIVTTDAVVTYADALDWATEMFPRKPEELVHEIAAVEPALAGMAAALAKRAEINMRQVGYPAGAVALASTRVFHAALIMAEVTRRGYQRFTRDLMDPQVSASPDEATDGKKGDVK